MFASLVIDPVANKVKKKEKSFQAEMKHSTRAGLFHNRLCQSAVIIFDRQTKNQTLDYKECLFSDQLHYLLSKENRNSTLLKCEHQFRDKDSKVDRNQKNAKK